MGEEESSFEVISCTQQKTFKKPLQEKRQAIKLYLVYFSYRLSEIPVPHQFSTDIFFYSLLISSSGVQPTEDAVFNAMPFA